MSITSERQLQGASDSTAAFNGLRRAPSYSNFKAVMETSSSNTAFFALSKRASPLAHLEFLRGVQSEKLLHTDEFMSPALHNSSDTYHRHVRAQLQYSIELSDGDHQRVWLKKTKQRKAFKEFTTQLGAFATPFLHGFQRQAIKKEEEVKFYGETKEEFLKREFEKKQDTGMAKCGWTPEDWYEITRSIIQEDLEMAGQELEDSYASIGTVTTVISSVFDDEKEDENTDDEDKYDHFHAIDDVKPVSRRISDSDATVHELAYLERAISPNESSEEDAETTQACTSFVRCMTFSTTNTSIEQFYHAKKPLLDESCDDFVKRSRDEAAKQNEPNKKSRLQHRKSYVQGLDNSPSDDTKRQEGDVRIPTTNTIILSEGLTPSNRAINKSTTNLLLSPSPLRTSWCYKPGSDSDSDDDEYDDEYDDENGRDWESTSPNSPSPPGSLLYDDSAIFDTKSEVDDPVLSAARQRKAQFLSDLLCVRSQVEIDVESDWELKVLDHEQKTQESRCESSKRGMPIYIISLRLHMDKNKVLTTNAKDNIHFKCSHKVGSHEVEFKGALRDRLLRKGKKHLGGRVDKGFMNVKGIGEWASLMEEDDSYGPIRKVQHLAKVARDDEVVKKELRDAARSGVVLQQILENYCMNAIMQGI